MKSRLMSLTLICLAAIGSHVSAAELRIRETATVSGRVVTLADVATINGYDSKAITALNKIALSPAPSPGETVRIDYSAIRAKLRASGVDMSRLRISGRTNVLVTGARPTGIRQAGFTKSPNSLSTILTRRAEDRLNREITSYLSRVASNLGKLEVATQVSNRDAIAVVKARRSTFEFSGFQSPLYRRQTITVRFTDTAGKSRTIRVGCMINDKPYVVAARHQLTRGSLIQQSDLILKQVDKVRDGIDKPSLAVGSEVKRTIRKGAVIRRNDIRRKPLVRRNQNIYVVARRSGITITRVMRARADGAHGDFITVLDPKSRQDISVRVIGDMRAEVPTGSGATSGRGSQDIIYRRASSQRKAKAQTSSRFRRFQPHRYDKDRRPPVASRSRASAGTR